MLLDIYRCKPTFRNAHKKKNTQKIQKRDFFFPPTISYLEHLKNKNNKKNHKLVLVHIIINIHRAASFTFSKKTENHAEPCIIPQVDKHLMPFIFCNPLYWSNTHAYLT